MNHALARLLESYGVGEDGKELFVDPTVTYLPHLDQFHVAFVPEPSFRAIPIQGSSLIVLKEADGDRIVGFRIRDASRLLSQR